jgi:hypothetical protein
MSEMLRYQKELDEVKKIGDPIYKVKRIYEFSKSLENSSLPSDYKELFSRAAKSEIPTEVLPIIFENKKNENEFDPLIYISSVVGGNLFYNVLKSAFYSFLDEIKKAAREGAKGG